MEHILSNLIVTNIARRLSITDYSMISVCVGSLSEMLVSLKNNFNVESDTLEIKKKFSFFYILFKNYRIHILVLFFIFSTCAIGFNNCFVKKLSSKKKSFSSLTLFNKEDQNILSKYIKMCPFILSKHFEMQKGFMDNYFKPYTTVLGDAVFDSVYNTPNVPIDYYDENFNAQIQIVWNTKCEQFNEKQSNSSGSNGEDNKVNKTIYFPIITLKISNNQSIKHVHDYYEKLNQYVINESKDKINTFNCKILKIHTTNDINSFTYSNENLSVKMKSLYKGPFLLFSEKKKMFIDSFFKKEKELLVKYVYKIEYEKEFFYNQGQNPKIGLILYGPPGSGKSTLIYRLARCLDRNIINIDLNDIYLKKHLLEILDNPYTGYRNTHNNITVLEEFDVALNKLHNLETSKKQKKKDKKENIDQEIIKKLKEQDKTNNLSNRSFPGQKHDYTINDLLAIFDGTAPANGRIIIATTNNFEQIYSLCPALFRVGRLTPIYIGYLKKDELEELSMFHFKRSILNDINIDHLFQESNGEFVVPTSNLTENISNFLIQTDNNQDLAFEKFKFYLNDYKI